MATYYQRITNSDITPSGNEFSKTIESSVGAGVQGITISLTASEVSVGYFFTVASTPNNDNWEDGGTQTIKIWIGIGAGNMNIDARIRIARYNSGGTYQESGSYTGSQALSAGGGVYTFSPVSPTWSGGACGDRIAFEVEFTNTDTMMSQSTTIQVEDNFGSGSPNEVTTDISEDVANCGGESTAVQDPILSGGVIPFNR